METPECPPAFRLRDMLFTPGLVSELASCQDKPLSEDELAKASEVADELASRYRLALRDTRKYGAFAAGVEAIGEDYVKGASTAFLLQERPVLVKICNTAKDHGTWQHGFVTLCTLDRQLARQGHPDVDKLEQPAPWAVVAGRAA